MNNKKSKGWRRWKRKMQFYLSWIFVLIKIICFPHLFLHTLLSESMNCDIYLMANLNTPGADLIPSFKQVICDHISHTSIANLSIYFKILWRLTCNEKQANRVNAEFCSYFISFSITAQIQKGLCWIQTRQTSFLNSLTNIFRRDYPYHAKWLNSPAEL